MPRAASTAAAHAALVLEEDTMVRQMRLKSTQPGFHAPIGDNFHLSR